MARPQAAARHAALVLAAGLCALGCAGQQKPGALEVKDLTIEGARQVSANDIKSKILTSETSWVPFSSKQIFDPTTWQADLRRIVRYYQAEGFYQAEIVRDQVNHVGSDAVTLTVEVREGSPTRITTLKVKGLEALPENQREDVLGKLALKEGERFVEDQWELSKAQMQVALREMGYAQAVVKGTAFVAEDANTAQLLIDITPGIRFRFGKIFVATGPNPHVRTARIIEQAEGAIHQGQWYSETALAEAQSRVFGMGVFAAVKVNRGAPDVAHATVPVVVDVREAPFRTVRAGGGIGLDQARQEVRAIAEYTNRNFFGDLRKFSINGKVGYAFLPSIYSVATHDTSKVLLSSPIFTLTNSFEQPHLFFRDVKGLASIELSRGVEAAYQYWGGRLKAGVVWQPHPAVTVSPSYNLEAYNLQGEAVLGGRAPALAFGCPQPCVLSYLEQQVTWDRRNDPLEPTRGYYLSVSFQEGGGPLGGVFDYVRIQPEARYYASVGRFTLAARLRVGTLLPGSGNDFDSPIISRFYSGGSDMRGFGYQRLSPLLAVQTSENEDETGVTPGIGALAGDTVPVGGNGMFNGTLELRYSLTDDVVLAAFLDTGFVTSRRFQFDSPSYFANNLQYALGLGLRYKTVIGPIRVDFAHRLNIGPELPVFQPSGMRIDYPVNGGCFGIGGNGRHFAGAPEGMCNLEISIGEAF
jgi:translocation and assembly module TamA